jgi:hypothetical protein
MVEVALAVVVGVATADGDVNTHTPRATQLPPTPRRQQR